MTADALVRMYKDNLCADEKKELVLGSVYNLKPGLSTINTVLRVTLYPKSGDVKMICSYAIDLLVHLDRKIEFNIMDFIVEMINGTSADLKRS